MPRPLLIVSQSDYLIQTVDKVSHIEWQTAQIQISWLLQKAVHIQDQQDWGYMILGDGWGVEFWRIGEHYLYAG